MGYDCVTHYYTLVSTIIDFNQMPPDAREMEIPEPEYTDLLNLNVTDKKRKLCVDIGGSNGGSVRAKKDTGKYMRLGAGDEEMRYSTETVC